MRPTANSLLAALVLSMAPTFVAAQSNGTMSGPLPGATQQQLGNCGLHRYLSIVGQTVESVQLPSNSRVVVNRPSAGHVDPNRLTVVVTRPYANSQIVRVYCG